MGREPLRRGLCGGGGDGAAPAFTAFYIDVQANPLEVGAPSLANPTFKWATVNPTKIVPNSVQIDDLTAVVNIATGLADIGSYAATYGAITKLAATNERYQIRAQNIDLTHFARLYDLWWRWRGYYGEAVNAGPLLEANVKALRVNSLLSGFAGAYVFLGGGYKYICYPKVLGLATVFKDQSTGFDVAMDPPYEVSVTNAFLVATQYYVHRTWNILGGAITIVVS